MFPVDYEESFFQRVATGQDGLQNLMAVNRWAQRWPSCSPLVSPRLSYGASLPCLHSFMINLLWEVAKW